MTPDLPVDPNIRRLIDAHPALFRGQAPLVPSSVQDGWYGLVHELCSDIEATLGREDCTRATVEQIKEKFGGLRFYIAFGGRQELHVDVSSPNERAHLVLDASGSGNDERDARERRVQELIGIASGRSASICILCGASGEMRNVRGWLKPLCSIHAAESEMRTRESP